MIEIPESSTLAQQLEDTLKGRTAISVTAAQSPHGFAFYFEDPALYHDRLKGKTITGARGLASFVEIQAENMRLLFNDGSNLRFLSPEDAIPKKHQLLVEFDDGCKMVCTVQMYGGLMAFEEGELDGNLYYQLARTKPAVLSDDFDEAYFMSLYENTKKTLSAKAFLATEQRIPGLGNGVLQDILFNARIHPKRKISTFSEADLKHLFRVVKTTLKDMTEGGGRNTEKDLFGHPGGYRTLLSSKTLKEPCPDCGNAIMRQAYLGGNVYFCPHCQPLE